MTVLEGIRIVDCSEGIAGPKAAMFLGDFGADVVKVEPPGGDRARRDPGFAVWNRNKRSVVIDQGTAAGRTRLYDLLRGADVCLFGDPLPVLRERGFDPATVSAINPSIVYVHVPPYAAGGPDSWLPESAELLSAASGIAYEQYSWEDVPVDPVMPHLLYAQAMWAAVATVATLYERLESGHGQVLTVSGMHATLTIMTGTTTDHPGIIRGPRPGGAAGPMAFYRLYQCADDEWLIMAALTPAFFTEAFGLLGILDEVFADPRLGGEPLAMALPQNAPWVIALAEAAFRTKPRDEWLALFRESGIAAGPARTREQWFHHPQVEAIGMRVTVDDGERGQVEMPGIPTQLSLTPGAIRRPAPRLGEHDASVEEREPRPVPHGLAPQPKGPLEGLRILDLGVVIAGTFPGTLLGELGADDIKVEPPGGDSLRNFAPTFLGYNKGKRSMVIDLQKPEGRETFHRLVRGADVVFDNYRPGVLERLGLDYETLRAIKPDIIQVSVTANGEVGPLRMEAGFDPVFQAGSGMMLAQGGGEPCFLTTPVTDTPTALMGALGACLALYHRRRTGLGQRATTSLAAASVMMQSGEIVEFAGRPPARMGGRDFQGPSAFGRYYAVADGRIRVRAVSEGEREGLVTAGFLGAEMVHKPPPTAGRDYEAAVAGQLAAAFAGVTREQALMRLSAAGMPARPMAMSFRECFEGQPEPAEPWMEWIALGNGSRVLASGRFLEMSRTPIEGPTVPPGLGEHTTAVLHEGGFSEDEIAALLAQGVVAQGAAFSV